MTSTCTLSSAESASLIAALGAAKLNCSISCGADKPVQTLEIDSPTAFAPETFTDQFYHCTNDGKQYVDGLDGIASALDTLAR